jgi:hypothetical protein
MFGKQCYRAKSWVRVRVRVHARHLLQPFQLNLSVEKERRCKGCFGREIVDQKLFIFILLFYFIFYVAVLPLLING